MSKTKEIHKCNSTINFSTSQQITRYVIYGRTEICGCNAKYFENDEWYCGRHAPSKVAERERKLYEKWLAKRK